MANDSNYIGIAMGLDVSDLKSGLSDANKQIQLANSEFKAASSGMDDWRKSTEGLTAKVKQLDTVLNLQKSKLAGLQAEYEKVAEEQGENSEAARKLKVQINNQTAVVNQTAKELENYSTALQEAEDGTEGLGEAAKKSSKELADVGDGAKDAEGKLGTLKGIAGGVVAGFAAIGAGVVAAVGSFLSLAESTREIRENFNKLETAFESAGHSAEVAQGTYKELYGILGDEGAATEAAQQLAKISEDEKDLAANTRILTGVMAEYGSSIPTEGLAEGMAATAAMGSVQGVLADALEWQGVNLDDYNAKLETMATEEERAAYIQETLTKLYGESADAFAEKNKSIIEAREAEAALTQVTAELGAIAEPIMTTLKLLAVDLLNTIKPFVSMIGTGLQGALNGSAGATQTLADGLGGILDTIVTKVMETLPTILNLVLQLFPSITSTILAALPQLLTTITELVGQVLGLLTTLLPQILTQIVAILPQLINSLIAAVPQLLQAATTLLMAIVDAIPTLITSLISALPSVIQTIITAVVESIPILLEAAISLLNAIVDAIPVLIDSLVENLPTIIETLVNGLVDALPLLLDAAITLFFAIIDAIPEIVSALFGEMPKIISTILTAISNAVPKLFSTAKQLLQKIIDAVSDLVKKLPSNMKKIIDGIVKGLGGGLSKVKEVGTDLIKGLWEGISDMASWIGEKIKGFGESVLGGIKNFFGIASPSKLMRDQVGKFIGQGIGVGILDSMPDVKKNIGKFSDFISENIGGIKTGLTLGVDGDLNRSGVGGRDTRTAGNTVVNAGLTVNYNGALSRKQIKQQEDDHYKSIRMKLKAEGAI